jgi:hypothetical protein
MKDAERPKLPRKESETSYQIEEVDDAVIDRFVHEHAGDANEKYWVGMSMVREADGYELFTFGSGPCVDMAFVSSGSRIKLGHLPYVYIDRTKQNLERTEEEDVIDDLLQEFSGSKGWTLYLFALAPSSDTDDAKKVRDASTNDLITRFSSIGIRCVDLTIKDYDIWVSGLIIDPIKRRIQVSYRKRSSKRK